MQKPLTEVPAYRSFIQARDRALEALLNRANSESSDVLSGALTQVVAFCLGQYESLKLNPAMAFSGVTSGIDALLQAAAPRLAEIQKRLMRQAEILSALGQAEALARTQGKAASLEFLPERPQKNSRDEPIEGRVRVALQRIAKPIADAVQAAAWLGEDLEAFERRLARALPKKTKYKRPPRTLKPMKEADPFTLGGQPFDIEGQKVFMTAGFMSDEEWSELVDHVTSTYIYTNRGPDSVLKLPAAKGSGTIELYEWEYEKEITNEFVTSVMRGENKAAKANGVKSLIWIAIVDDATDDCCLWRDGLTVEEIKFELQNKHADDECDAIAPPAHPNCRCRLAPVVDDETLQPPESNLPEFEQWLTTI